MRFASPRPAVCSAQQQVQWDIPTCSPHSAHCRRSRTPLRPATASTRMAGWDPIPYALPRRFRSRKQWNSFGKTRDHPSNVCKSDLAPPSHNHTQPRITCKTHITFPQPPKLTQISIPKPRPGLAPLWQFIEGDTAERQIHDSNGQPLPSTLYPTSFVQCFVRWFAQARRFGQRTAQSARCGNIPLLQTVSASTRVAGWDPIPCALPRSRKQWNSFGKTRGKTTTVSRRELYATPFFLSPPSILPEVHDGGRLGRHEPAPTKMTVHQTKPNNAQQHDHTTHLFKTSRKAPALVSPGPVLCSACSPCPGCLASQNILSTSPTFSTPKKRTCT